MPFPLLFDEAGETAVSPLHHFTQLHLRHSHLLKKQNSPTTKQAVGLFHPRNQKGQPRRMCVGLPNWVKWVQPIAKFALADGLGRYDC